MIWIEIGSHFGRGAYVIRQELLLDADTDEWRPPGVDGLVARSSPKTVPIFNLNLPTSQAEVNKMKQPVGLCTS